MFQPGDSVLVGVSGGPDSVALLYVLQALALQTPLQLGVSHLNHCLRGSDSDRDAAFVEALARKLELPCHIQKIDVAAFRRRNRLSTEEAARQVRHAFFKDIAAGNGYEKIALAHHADDNAELVLLFLFRGSGPLGVKGMLPVRDGAIVRPFIAAVRSEILDFLHANEIAYVRDRSNRDVRYVRNRLRLELIPLLKKRYNPQIVTSLNRLAAILRSEDEWMETLTAPLYERACPQSKENGLVLLIERLTDLSAAPLRRIIRRAIADVKGDLRRIGFEHIRAVTRLIVSGPRTGRLDLPDRVSVRRLNERLIFTREARPLRSLKAAALPAAAPTVSFQYEVRAPGIVRIGEIGRGLKFEEVDKKSVSDIREAGHRTAFFDMNRLVFPLQIRNFRPGDRFHPLGMSGTQKLKKFFIDHKIPRSERNRCPLLLSRGEIIWVAGHRSAETAKVRPATRRILKAELLLA